ncbi:hypothetical protein LOK49_LG10G01482, partial [Camellia lanceoleosa]
MEKGLFVTGNWGSTSEASFVLATWKLWDDLQIPSLPYFPTYDYAYAQGHGQGSPPMVQEHFQSVIILNTTLPWCFNWTPKRIIRCGGVVDDDMANIIVSQLLYLETRLVAISSSGGRHVSISTLMLACVHPFICLVCTGLGTSDITHTIFHILKTYTMLILNPCFQNIHNIYIVLLPFQPAQGSQK